MSKHPKYSKKNSVPVFDALNFPIQCFVLFKDGRQWKDIAQARKSLYVHIARHGDKAWPGIKGLMRKTGFSRRTVYNLLADLKELGCIEDATDSKGRKYSGERGPRVRLVNNGALPINATGWLFIKAANLWIRVVAGVQNSPIPVLAGVQNSRAGVQNSDSRSAELEDKIVVTDTNDKELVSRKNLLKELNERTNPPKQNGGDFWESTPLDMGGPDDKARAKIDKARAKYGDDDVKAALAEWIRTKETTRLLMPWKMFADDCERFCVEIQRDRQHKAMLDAETARISSQCVPLPEMPDGERIPGGADDYFKP